MSHPYVCNSCGRERTCSIAGCRGDCEPVCVACVPVGKGAAPANRAPSPYRGLALGAGALLGAATLVVVAVAAMRSAPPAPPPAVAQVAQPEPGPQVTERQRLIERISGRCPAIRPEHVGLIADDLGGRRGRDWVARVLAEQVLPGLTPEEDCRELVAVWWSREKVGGIDRAGAYLDALK